MTGQRARNMFRSINRMPLFGAVLVLVIGSVTFSAISAQTEVDRERDALPAVVQIAVRIVETDIQSGRREEHLVPLGSGVVISPIGVVLTANHVLDLSTQQELAEERGASNPNLTVDVVENQYVLLFSERDEPPRPRFTAELAQADPSLDLAVLRIFGGSQGQPLDPGELNLPFLSLGDSNQVAREDLIWVIGYPGIATTALIDSGEVNAFETEPGITGRAWIVTDATVSGGSSGGPAVNDANEIIGITSSASELECRPGDTNHDNKVDELDIGCISVGSAVAKLRPVNLAKPMLEKVTDFMTPTPTPSATATLELTATATATRTLAPTLEPTATLTPTASPTSTSTLEPTHTPTATMVAAPSPTEEAIAEGLSLDILSLSWEDGNRLPGACYTLDDGEENCDDDGDAEVTFTGIQPGMHTLTQSQAPEGYKIADTAEIDLQKDTQINLAHHPIPPTEVAGDPGELGELTVGIVSVDSEFNLLAGACFTLDEGDENCDDDGDGEVTFTDVRHGIHVLTETRAPEGYENFGTFEIDLLDDGRFSVPHELGTQTEAAPTSDSSLSAPTHSDELVLNGQHYQFDRTVPIDLDQMQEQTAADGTLVYTKTTDDSLNAVYVGTDSTGEALRYLPEYLSSPYTDCPVLDSDLVVFPWGEESYAPAGLEPDLTLDQMVEIEVIDDEIALYALAADQPSVELFSTGFPGGLLRLMLIGDNGVPVAFPDRMVFAGQEFQLSTIEPPDIAGLQKVGCALRFPALAENAEAPFPVVYLQVGDQIVVYEATNGENPTRADEFETPTPAGSEFDTPTPSTIDDSTPQNLGMVSETRYESPQFGYIVEWDDAWSVRSSEVDQDVGLDSLLIGPTQSEGALIQISGVLARDSTVDSEISFLTGEDYLSAIYGDDNATVLITEENDRSGGTVVVSDGGESITLNEVYFLEDQQTLVFVSMYTTSEQFVESFVAANGGIWLNGEPILSIWNMDEILAELGT